MVKRVLGLTVVVILIGAAGAYVLSAGQGTPKTSAAAPPATDVAKMPLVNINVVQIKPELVDEWMEFQKSETMPALQKAGVRTRTAVATVIGPAFEYAFLTRPENFAERDGDNPIVKALGRDGARAYAQKNRRFVATTSRRPKTSNTPRGGSPYIESRERKRSSKEQPILPRLTRSRADIQRHRPASATT